MVPQLVVDAGIIPEGKQVVCVQPHQNSAVSMGEYVAQKRLKACGTEVGYQIRFVNQTGPNTRLVYATPDLLLRRLQIDPGFTTVGMVLLMVPNFRETGWTGVILTSVTQAPHLAPAPCMPSSVAILQGPAKYCEQHSYQLPAAVSQFRVAVVGAILLVHDAIVLK